MLTVLRGEIRRWSQGDCGTPLCDDGYMDLSGVPTELLEAELVSHAAWETAGMARIIQVLGEFDRREAWSTWECRNAQQWLGWKCGLGYTAATERLRVARVLPNLPVISAAFTGGLLSWSKIRELTRVATPGNETGLCDIGMAGTAAHVARLVSAMRRVTARQAVAQIAERRFAWHTEDDGAVTISVRLPADTAMSVIAAVRTATVPEQGVPWSRSAADAVVELVAGFDAPRPEVVVHVESIGASFEDGPAIADEIADCLACDGPVTTVVESPDGPVVDRRRTPTKGQRRRLALRHRTCQFPGCHHAGRFDAHHVVDHRRGGRTVLRNLVRACAFHHRMIHLHHLVLTLHSDRRLTSLDRSLVTSSGEAKFTSRSGWEGVDGAGFDHDVSTAA